MDEYVGALDWIVVIAAALSLLLLLAMLRAQAETPRTPVPLDQFPPPPL